MPKVSHRQVYGTLVGDAVARLIRGLARNQRGPLTAHPLITAQS
jgi:hypothetical protein